MNIGEAAKASGVSAKMIRHYEETGLIRPAKRTQSNYRVYSPNDVQVLRFIKQARRLGFSMNQITLLLGLWQDGRPSSEVTRLALEHIGELELRIRELVEMKETLENLAKHCRGDSQPECPILNDLTATPLTQRGHETVACGGALDLPVGGRPMLDSFSMNGEKKWNLK
jgi:MerR family copper efflux transcriptional regulator